MSTCFPLWASGVIDMGVSDRGNFRIPELTALVVLSVRLSSGSLVPDLSCVQWPMFVTTYFGREQLYNIKVVINLNEKLKLQLSFKIISLFK